MTSSQVTLGIYEKALRWTGSWDSFLTQVPEAGFSFVDLSVDESTERSLRLKWTPSERRIVVNAARNAGTMIGGICLSVHRKVGPGSADPLVRAQALEIFHRGIDLCHDLGITVLQIAGYYAYYEDADPDARARYGETLSQALPHAAQAGVILGIENVDGNDINSIPRAMSVCNEIPSPWLQIYPDIGNIAEHGGDAKSELSAGKNHMVAIHIKDVLPGQPRRIPLGEGIADFAGAFAELAAQKWCGRMMIEMWNDEALDSIQRCQETRQKVLHLLKEAKINISNPKNVEEVI